MPNPAVYTDTLPVDATPITVPVEETYYGTESVRTFYLNGRFVHNNGRFSVGLFKDGVKALVAQASVISSHRVGARPTIVDVTDGDFLEINGDVFQIRDNKALCDPRLVFVPNRQAMTVDAFTEELDKLDDILDTVDAALERGDFGTAEGQCTVVVARLDALDLVDLDGSPEALAARDRSLALWLRARRTF